jgi:hypothetical protein
MKRQILFGTLLSAALATGVAAQQPPASGDPASRPGQSSDSAQTITVSGCLAAASAGGASSTAPGASSTAPGAASSSAAAGGFVLNNATTGTMANGSSPTGAPGAAPGATGTSGTASSAGTTYKLVGGDSSDLQKNVGKKVEVTGSVAARSSSSPSGSPSESPASASGSGQSFQVKSIRATGESCSQ